MVARDDVEALGYLFATNAPAGHDINITPALILLDPKLPRLDGLQVLQRVRADGHTRRIPVVVLNSSKEDQGLISSYDLGANSYIRKPVEFDKFVEAAGLLEMCGLMCNAPPPL